MKNFNNGGHLKGKYLYSTSYYGGRIYFTTCCACYALLKFESDKTNELLKPFRITL